MNNNKIKNHSNDSLFFTRSNLDNTKVDNIVSDALHKADDGELFMEFCESESFVFDDQRLKSASFDTSKGFGLRAIAGESSGYAHSSDIDEKALKKASDTVNFITKDNNANFNASFSKTNRKLYHEVNPINETAFSENSNAPNILLLSDMPTAGIENDWHNSAILVIGSAPSDSEYSVLFVK